jgi:hypothetical protein
MKYQPAAVTRDQRQVEDWTEFEKACQEGKFQPSQFIHFMVDKYRAQWDREGEAEGNGDK